MTCRKFWFRLFPAIANIVILGTAMSNCTSRHHVDDIKRVNDTAGKRCHRTILAENVLLENANLIEPLTQLIIVLQCPLSVILL